MNQLWRSNLDQLGPDIEAYLIPMLSPLESEKLWRLKRPERRKEYILSRALMRMALSHEYHQPLAHWQFSESPNATPRLLNPIEESIFLSLSHSGNYVMVALSEQAVGLDVEQMQSRNETFNIARKVFTSEQQAHLKSLPAKLSKQQFYRLWTHKEALVKALAGSVPSFQMISASAWPKNDFHIQHGEFNQHFVTLASKQPDGAFDQFHATPFEQIKIAQFLNN